VAAWLRRGEIEGQKVDCQSFQPRSFLAALQKIRSLTQKGPEVFEPGMKELCAGSGVAVVFIPELPGTRLWSHSVAETFEGPHPAQFAREK
jgi:hypothetical protein